MLSLRHWLSIFLFASTVYVVGLVIYRVWLCPIAAFPGPLLAKMTHWYEFYYNYFLTGMYYKRIHQMHEKYGPVVRVSPDEIHVLDSSSYRKLFVTGSVRKTNSYQRFSRGTGFEDMSAISETHDAHKKLRLPLDRLFSRGAILKFEARVTARVDRLCDRLAGYQGTGDVVSLSNAFSSLTTDVVSSVIFQDPSDYLSAADFNAQWYETLKRGTTSVTLFKHMPWVVECIQRPILKRVVANITRWSVWDEQARRQVLLSRKRPADTDKTRDESTVLDQLVHSSLVEAELGGPGGFARLAQLIQQAGAHNVSHTLSTIVFHLLLEQPAKLAPLRRELAEVWAGRDRSRDPPGCRELEKAPYLNACVSEGLRMAVGNMNRTPRIFPDDHVDVCGWRIPAGTPISMSSYWMHNDPSVFPRPESFEPQRWLDADAEQIIRMKNSSVPFGGGSRACVGQQ